MAYNLPGPAQFPALEENVGFRVVAANQQPDFRTRSYGALVGEVRKMLAQQHLAHLII